MLTIQPRYGTSTSHDLYYVTTWAVRYIMILVVVYTGDFLSYFVAQLIQNQSYEPANPGFKYGLILRYRRLR